MPMSTRAKFYVHSVEKIVGDTTTVKLNVVCRGEDNKEWSKYTPSGNIQMSIKNELAAEQFEPGNEFYVTFDPAPKGQEG